MHWHHRAGLLLIGTIGIISLGVVDYHTPPYVAIGVFYFVPIGLVSWFAGRGAGVALALLAGACWMLDEQQYATTHIQLVAAVWSVLAKTCVAAVVALLLASIHQALQHETREARTDSLTCVANRRAFLELAGRQIHHSRRVQRPFTLAYVDIDDFKSVNDRFGHASGDSLLALTATTIRANLRAGDVVARLGGDEFGILLADANSATAEKVVTRVQNRLMDAIQRGGWPVNFSIGMVTFDRAPEHVDAMLRQADELMYSVKSARRKKLRHMVVG